MQSGSFDLMVNFGVEALINDTNYDDLQMTHQMPQNNSESITREVTFWLGYMQGVSNQRKHKRRLWWKRAPQV